MPLGRALIVIALLMASGCEKTPPPADRYVPAPDAAQSALHACLMEWKEGRDVGPISGRTPAVNVVDSHRRTGQTLEEFDILGEVPGGGFRQFAVRLTLNPPAQEERVRYIVIGIDPLWVFRQEDYDMLAHWDHVMDPEPPPAPTTPSENAGSTPEAPRE
jgi:hypothetical protein